MGEVLHPEEVVTTVFLVRHGDTRQTDEGRLYTDPEAQLTEKGRGQIRGIASWLGDEGIEALISSSSKRVLSSAEIIAAQLKVNILTNDAFNAWRVGEWEGRTYLEVKKAEPQIYQSWVADPVRNAPPGGEAILDVSKRATEAIRQVIGDNEGKRLAVVSHAEVIRALLVDALGMPLENYWRIAVPTGSITKIDYSAHFATAHFISLRPHEYRHKMSAFEEETEPECLHGSSFASE